MRINIISDGTPEHTTITDADTGERITNVIDVDININFPQGGTAKLTIYKPLIELSNIKVTETVVVNE